jgi:hypothetical protein
MAPLPELVMNYLGMAACVGAAGYLYVTGHKKAAALLLAGFILQLQLAVYMTFIDSSLGDGGCWLEKSFYQCLPLGQKLSIHAAQAGHYLIALGIFILALASRRRAIPTQ